MAGSRPGSVIAGAWAVMTHIGEDGYAKSCEQICGAAGNLKKRIKSDFIDELYVLGDPLVSVVAFGSRTLNIYAIGDRMSKRGWHLSALANPAALHMAVTMPVSRSIDKLIEDLRFVVDEVKADKSTEGKGDLVALYGKPIVIYPCETHLLSRSNLLFSHRSWANQCWASTGHRTSDHVHRHSLSYSLRRFGIRTLISIFVYACS